MDLLLVQRELGMSLARETMKDKTVTSARTAGLTLKALAAEAPVRGYGWLIS